MALLDGFGRKIDYLRVSITDRCNFRCVYCMPDQGVSYHPHPERLTVDELARLVQLLTAMGIEKVRLTGGEPTMHKDLIEIVRQIALLKPRSFGMTTNGFRLPHLANELKAAGLHRLNISLDSLKRERFAQMARFDGFEQTWKAVWHCLELGFQPVKINVVVLRGINDDEMLDFVELTKSNPFHVRFIEYMPSSSGEGNVFDESRIIRAAELREIVGRQYTLEPIQFGEKTGPAKMFRVAGYAGEIGFIDPYADHFCSSCNRIRLTSVGRLRWCLFSDDGIDLRALLRDGADDDYIQNVIREKILSDKPAHHPLGVSEMVQINTVFSHVGG